MYYCTECGLISDHPGQCQLHKQKPEFAKVGEKYNDFYDLLEKDEIKQRKEENHGNNAR